MNKKFQMKIDLYDAIDYIQNYERDFIVDFLGDTRINKVKRIVLSRYYYNREDLECEVNLLVIEFVTVEFSLEEYVDEDTFLEDLRKYIRNGMDKIVKYNYGYRETSFSDDYFVMENQPCQDDTSDIDLRILAENLTEREKQVFDLCYIKDLREKDAAKLLGIGQSTLNETKSRIIKKFTNL